MPRPKGPKQRIRGYRPKLGVTSYCTDGRRGRKRKPVSWKPRLPSADNSPGLTTGSGAATLDAEFSESNIEEQPPVQGGAQPVLTHYGKAKEQEVARWASLRSLFIDTSLVVEAPQSSVCSVCKEFADPLIRCQDCSLHFICCRQCFENIHSTINLFHYAEQWKDESFWPMSFTWEVKSHSICPDAKYARHLNVWDKQGRPHAARFEFCKCEKESVTLLGHGFWPGSPERPQVAYATELLDWLESLQLECHVSVLGFCNALRWKNRSFSREQFKNLYRVLVSEAFEEYKHFKFQMRNIGEEGATQCIECPACPREGGNIYISMDANFGLVQKKSSGSSLEPAKHGSLLFLNQDSVDAFVQEYGNADSKVHEGECNDFQAGNRIRSKIKNQKLRFTGVFGCACMHEVPLTFLNLRHGERLAYPIYIMSQLQTLAGSRTHFGLLYDIACMLETHLKKTKQTDMLKRFTFAIPVFHSYGHQVSCQVKYSPRRLDGFCLLDGELMERLWSYLRPFSKITKEMTPGHRIDMLTDALLHWREKKIEQIDLATVQKMDHAKKQTEVCGEKLNSLLKATSESLGTGPFTATDVVSWINEEKCNFEAEKMRKKAALGQHTWKEAYVCKLRSIFNLRQQQRSENADKILSISKQCSELERKLKQIESKQKLERWKAQDEEYIQTAHILDERAKSAMLTKMQNQARELQYLIHLRQKYSDGQAVAQRLGKKIKVLTSAMRKLCIIFNNQKFRNMGSHFPHELQFSDINTPEKEVFQALPEHEPSLVPQKVKREAVELLLQIARATEEMEKIPMEMSNIMKHYLARHRAICTASVWTGVTGDSPHQMGRKALLKRKANQLSHRLHELKHAFCPYSAEVMQMQLPESVRLSEDSPCDMPQSVDSEYMELVMMPSTSADTESDSDADGCERQRYCLETDCCLEKDLNSTMVL